MLFRLFAHAGEVHETTIEASAHEIAWFIQLPIFLLCIYGLLSLLTFITKRRDNALLITAFVLLIVGFLGYRVSPIVSATAITLGLTSTLLVTLVGLGREIPKETKSTKS